MKILIHISLLLIIPFGLVSQNSRDLSSTDQRNLYQGIIYSKRNDCYKANEYLNLFILNYNGTDKDYWLLKAKSYVLPCNEMTILKESIDYLHRPEYKLQDSGILPTHNHNDEEYVAPDIDITIDLYRNTFDLITSLSPEVKYPLIDVNDLIENVDEDHNHKDEEWADPEVTFTLDIYRNTFDLITSLSPEVKYPLIDVNNLIENVDEDVTIVNHNHYDEEWVAPNNAIFLDVYRNTFGLLKSLNTEAFYPLIETSSDVPTEINLSIWLTTDYHKQVIKNKSITNIWPQAPDEANKDMLKSNEYKEALKRYLNQRKSRSEIKSNNKELTSLNEDKVVNENNESSISKKIKHYRILFTVNKSPDKTFMALSNYGPVTSTQTKSGYYAYYVGYTQDQKKAEKLLLKVQKSGYKVAEIVEFSEETKGVK